MTGENADVGRLDMKIAVEKSFIAVQLFAHVVGECAYKRQAGFFKKQQGVAVRNAGAAVYFLSYFLEVRGLCTDQLFNGCYFHYSFTILWVMFRLLSSYCKCTK